MINVILCGYRDWANEIFEEIKGHKNINLLGVYKTNESFLSAVGDGILTKVDVAIFIGWSWILDAEITNKCLCVGVHPSDLPYFRGGSPIQHQIIEGITKSKVTLMTLSSKKLDGGDFWLKSDVSFDGSSMSLIFENIIDSSIVLLNDFLNKYPNIVPTPQEGTGTYFARRNKGESRITNEEWLEQDLIKLYNKIRCLTEPYPNAYIEGSNGDRLYFEKVRLVKSEEL
jgi:methionyl-tRNA formyltransferase